jgi:hypothetical protein
MDRKIADETLLKTQFKDPSIKAEGTISKISIGQAFDIWIKP